MDALDLYLEELEKSQSPYKGFNSYGKLENE